MNTSYFSTAIEVVTVVFEIFIISTYFNTFLTPRSGKKLSVKALIYAAATGAIIAVSLFLSNPLVLISVTSLAMFLISTLYEGPVRTKLLFILLFDAFIAIVEYATFYLVYFLNGLTFVDTRESGVNRILGIIISKLLVFILVKLIYYGKKESVGRLPFVSSLFLSILPVSSIVVIFQLVISSHADQLSTTSTGFALFGVVSLFASNLAVFRLFEQQMAAQNERERMRMIEQQILNQTEYYKDLVDRQTEIREIRHDLKNCLSSLAHYLNINDFQHAAEYSEKIETMANSLKSQVDTGYHALDIVLWGKVRLAEQCKIDFAYSIFMPGELHIDEMDLCVILANALDNAIEACKKMEEEFKRKISLILKTEGVYLSIYLENSINKKVPVMDGGLIKTTKADSHNHGIGLQSIKNLAGKYQGDMDVSSEEQVFILSVLLKNARNAANST